MKAPPVLLALVALLALAAAPPPAAAHSEIVSQAQTFEIGPYTAALTPDPTPLYANTTPQAFRLEVIDTQKSQYADVQASLQIAGPNEYRDVVRFEKANARYYLASVRLTESGEHTARLVLDDGTEERFAPLTLQVYPDLPFRILPVDPLLDVIPDTRTLLAYEVVDPVELTRKDAFDDLTMRIERWSPDHRTLLATDEVALRHDGKGLWKLEHVFPEGHYYFRFASKGGGFNYEDLPLLHVNVLPPLDAPATASNETPAPVAGAVVALAVAAAVARARRGA